MDPHATQAAFGGQPKTRLGRPGVRRDFIRGGADAAATVLHTIKNQFFGRNHYIVSSSSTLQMHFSYCAICVPKSHANVLDHLAVERSAVSRKNVWLR